MTFFRGFIPVKGKVPLIPYKDGCQLYTLEQVKDCNGYAGVLEHDTVLVDVDDMVKANKLLDIIEADNLACWAVKTDRGMHFYFKNTQQLIKQCGTHLRLAIGIEADIKVGLTNSISVLKTAGKLRKTVYNKVDDEPYSEIPKWLIPVNSKIDLFNLDEGEGRNQALFDYILPLQAAGLSQDECKHTLALINEYILKKPLASKEFDTITRDEAFKKAILPNFFGPRDKFLFNVFAQYVVDTYNIRFINGQLHIYKDGIYVTGDEEIESKMIEVVSDLNKARRTEALAYARLLLQKDPKSAVADARFIAFNNGVLDIETGEMQPLSPDIVLLNKVPWDYRPDAKSALVNSTLDKLACGDKDIRALLEEIVGYTFYRRNELRKAFILYGDKHNGKSTFISMLMHMLEPDNVSTLDLAQLAVKFDNAEIYRKLVNLGDDIDDRFMKDTSLLKKFISGDPVTVERKNEHPFSFVNYAKFVFSTNNLPRSLDKTGAFSDRLIIVPFNAHFSKNDPDYQPYLKYELIKPDAIEALIALGVQGLKRVLYNQGFTQGDQVKQAMEEYTEYNNPILTFLNEIGNDIFNETVPFWFSQYFDYCQTNNLSAYSNNEFSKQVKRFKDVEIVRKRVNGKIIKVFAPLSK